MLGSKEHKQFCWVLAPKDISVPVGFVFQFCIRTLHFMQLKMFKLMEILVLKKKIEISARRNFANI